MIYWFALKYIIQMQHFRIADNWQSPCQIFPDRNTWRSFNVDSFHPPAHNLECFVYSMGGVIVTATDKLLMFVRGQFVTVYIT